MLMLSYMMAVDVGLIATPAPAADLWLQASSMGFVHAWFAHCGQCRSNCGLQLSMQRDTNNDMPHVLPDRGL